MSALLRKMKDPVPKKRKAPVNFDSDSSGDDMFADTQQKSKGSGSGAKTDVKKKGRVATDLLSDSDDDMNFGSQSSGDVEEESKRKANMVATALLANIQPVGTSPEDDSKVQSRRGGKRGKKGGGKGQSLVGSAQSKKAQDLLNSIKAKSAEQDRKKRSQELEARQNARKEEEVMYVALPTIMTASEREAAKSKTKRSSIETIDLLTSELGVPENIGAATSSHSNPSADSGYSGGDGGDGEGQGGLQVKTRLNGSHAASFVLPPGSTFGELHNMVVAFYGLKKQKGFKVTKLRLEFDGETLQNMGTPEDEDMEDGDLVDLILDESHLTAALEFAEEEAARKKQEQEQEQEPVYVKFCTRLNGEHEHKWKVKRGESFGTIMGKFAAFYGLDGGDVTSFQIDGEQIDKEGSPESLDMEDGDLIDVKVTASKYSAAVAHVGASAVKGSKPSSSEPEATPTSTSSAKKKKASDHKDNRVAVTFNIQALKEVTVSGEQIDTQIKLFSDSAASHMKHALVSKLKLLREDVSLSFTVVREGSSSKLIKLDKSLIDNGVHFNSMVQIRLSNISIKIRPNGLSKDGTSFVGEFLVQMNPTACLQDLSKALIKSKHLLFPRDQLTFTLIKNDGQTKVLDDDAVQSQVLLDIGFHDQCEMAVTKR